MSAEDKIRTMLLNLGFDDEIEGSAFLADDIGMDSLDKVELVVTLEDTFKIEITDAQADKLETLQDVLALVEKRNREQPG